MNDFSKQLQMVTKRLSKSLSKNKHFYRNPNHLNQKRIAMTLLNSIMNIKQLSNSKELISKSLKIMINIKYQITMLNLPSKFPLIL